MSYDIGRAALNLQWTERVARMEYVDNWEIVRHVTGKERRHRPEAGEGPGREFNDAIHLDFLWHTNDGPVSWSERGRMTNMGHAVYVEDGSDYVPSQPSPFTNSAEVLAFNAVEEYGLPDLEELVDYYEQSYQRLQAENPNQVVPGGYYSTIVSGAIDAFGWQMLLEAAGDDPEGFGDKVLGSFFELALHNCKAWAKTSIEFFLCHDDMVWTAGPFMRPELYRRYVFPRFAELWRVLHDAGKKVLFTADGTFDMFLDDLVAAGADGFCFEPTNDLAMMAHRVGKTHVLMGGMDCRTLTWGTKDDIERELRWALDTTRDCPGFFLCVGNHIPGNVPLENLIWYLKLVDELGRR